MDIISFNEASTANGRIEKFIENPDSTSGIVTVPKTIASGETITIPSGRVAVLPNVQVDGTLNIEGEVFVPSGSTFGDLESQIALKADTTYVNGKYSGFKNYIINGNFDVWQRGTDNTGGAGYLSADRWRIRGVNSAYSATVNMRAVREAAGVNQLLVKTATTDTGFAWIEQGIEFHKEDIGKTFTISFEIRDADNSLSKGSLKFAYRADGMDVRDGFNVFIENAVNLSTGFTKYSYTFTLPSFSNYVAIGIGLDGIGITSSDITLFRIKNIQLEEGSVATPFEQRPYGLELSLCQRYYEFGHEERSGCKVTGNNNVWDGYAHTESIRFKTIKRVAPTVATFNMYGLLSNNTGSLIQSLGSYGGPSTQTATIYGCGLAGNWAWYNNAGSNITNIVACSFDWTASAEL